LSLFYLSPRKHSESPWYERNSFWGPLALGIGVLLTVIAAMKHDSRWLLIVACPCFLLASWGAVRQISRPWAKHLLMFFIAVLICGSLFWLNVWLRPTKGLVVVGPPVSGQPNTQLAPAPPASFEPPLPDGMTLTPPPGNINLTFRSAPAFTPSTRQKITASLTRFRNYLVHLEIPVPVELPPIGTREKAAQNDATDAESSAPPGLPVYRGDIVVDSAWARDPRQFTNLYCGRIMSVLIMGDHASLQFAGTGFNLPPVKTGPGGSVSVTLGHPTPDALDVPPTNSPPITVSTAADMVLVSHALTTYFNRDFWNVSKPRNPAESASWSGAFWEIRQKYGSDFANQMIRYTLKDMRKFKYSGTGDYYFYFLNELKIGESVVDNGDGKNWLEIDSIFRRHVGTI
jgi:hypothetical protein